MCNCGERHQEGESCYCPCHSATPLPTPAATERPTNTILEARKADCEEAIRRNDTLYFAHIEVIEMCDAILSARADLAAVKAGRDGLKAELHGVRVAKKYADDTAVNLRATIAELRGALLEAIDAIESRIHKELAGTHDHKEAMKLPERLRAALLPHSRETKGTA